MEKNRLNRQLHWTTVYTEKMLLAVIGVLTVGAAGMDIYEMFLARKIDLADLYVPSSESHTIRLFLLKINLRL